MQLQGTKIVLREKRVTDAAEDYAWSTDEELSRLDATRPLSLSFQHALTLYEEELLYPPSRRVRFAIDTLDGRHIGNCMYYDISEASASAELGIMVGDRRYWNKSYGTDAVETLLRYIFTQTKLRRICLHTLDWNIRAQKAFEKSGFQATGRVRRNGYNFIAMEILKPRWEQRAAQHAEHTPA